MVSSFSHSSPRKKLICVNALGSRQHSYCVVRCLRYLFCGCDKVGNREKPCKGGCGGVDQQELEAAAHTASTVHKQSGECLGVAHLLLYIPGSSPRGCWVELCASVNLINPNQQNPHRHAQVILAPTGLAPDINPQVSVG